MKEWLAKNWWWLFPMVAAPLYFAFLAHRRGGDGPLSERMLYVVVPILDPKNENRKRFPQIIMLWGVGIVIIAIALLIEWLVVPR